MNNYIYLILFVIAIYLYFKPGDNYEPSQEEIQSGSYIDKTKNIKDFPFPQISRTFKKLSHGKSILPLDNDKSLPQGNDKSLPSTNKKLNIIRTNNSENIENTKTRMYLPDYYRKDRLSGNPDGTEELRLFNSDNKDKSENSWQDTNVSEHPKFYNADIKDELTDIGSFFDKNNNYTDKTTSNSDSLHSDSCYKDKKGNTFCEDNTRLQIIPPKLSDPNNPVLNNIGLYRENIKLNDMNDKVINGGIFFDNIKAAVNNTILSNYDNSPLEITIDY